MQREECKMNKAHSNPWTQAILHSAIRVALPAAVPRPLFPVPSPARSTA